ncbi:Wzz/FepE/Etk N-terminal domain-containing protein [Streptococcus suis]|uniref:YveK family protein n=1 Tax=Streptococcus suis TaxID=1307 RepID=UPI00240CFEE9|nr:Wzz/FepE/Etk N-terminal domain-containing protein [Streptococcus suis]WFA75452.1 Wzz/FepE/Etk N-terminal domain-containing protein [Streptococcus suis]
MENSLITPKQLFQELWQYKLMIVLVTFMLALGAGGYSKLFMTPVYQAKTTLLLKYKSSMTAEGEVDSNRELSSFNLYKNLLKTYVDMANLPIIDEKTAEAFPLNEEQKETLLELKATSIEETQLITITAQGTDLETLTGYLTTYGRTYQQFTTENFGTSNLSILSEAETTGHPISPNVLRNSVLGAILGFGLTVLIILIRYLMADQIRSIEELEQLWDLPVVGMIPIHTSKKNPIIPVNSGKYQRRRG